MRRRSHNLRVPSLGLSARLLALIFCAVVPPAIVSLVMAAREQAIETEGAKREALRLARLAALNEEQLIGGARQLLVALARLPQVRSGDPRVCGALMAELAPDFPQYRMLAAVRPTGEVFCSSGPVPPGVDVSSFDFFRRAVESRDFVVGEQIIGPIIRRPTIIFAQPALGPGGTVQAVVAASLDLDWLARLGPRVALSPGSSLIVVDGAGYVLTRHPEPATWTGQRVPEAPLVQAILERRGEGTADTVGLDGVPRLFAFTRVAIDTPGAALYVAVGIPKSKVSQEVHRHLVRNLSLVALMALIAVAAAWLGARWLVLQPVRQLTAATRRMAAGDLSARGGLLDAVGDLGELGRAYDVMALALESHERELQAARDDLARSLERFELFVQGVKGYALFMLDGDARIATWNAGALRLMGQTGGETLGRHFSVLFGGASHDAGLPEEIMAALRFDTVAERECLVRRGEAGSFWASLQVSVLCDVGGALRGYACLMHDLTELKRAQQEQRALARRVLSAQEDERRRVARELHDEIGQLLTALKLTMQALPHLPPGELEARTAAGLAAVDRAIAEVRALSLELRPLVLDDLGLSAAVRSHVDRRCRDAGLTANVHIELPGGRPPSEIETAAYRILQEALTNILRHARATEIWVDLVRTESALLVKVRDNGHGFDPARRRSDGGPPSMGLSSMRERAALVGGELEIDTAPGVGTIVRAGLPLTPAAPSLATAAPQ